MNEKEAGVGPFFKKTSASFVQSNKALKSYQQTLNFDHRYLDRMGGVQFLSKWYLRII